MVGAVLAGSSGLRWPSSCSTTPPARSSGARPSASAGYSLATAGIRSRRWIGRTGLIGLAAVVVLAINRRSAQPTRGNVIRRMNHARGRPLVYRSQFSRRAARHRHGRAPWPRRRGAHRSRAVEHAAGAARGARARPGIALADVRAILLTHIHLDHAGATGTLVHENPALRVYVHEKGAPHMVEPDKLIASATRLWGDEMDRLWGEFRPVPQRRADVLRGGERISAGGRDLDVAYTPGHASHHVSYLQRRQRRRVRRRHRRRPAAPSAVSCMPPTPPPDIDLELWRDSLRASAIGAPTRCSSRISAVSRRRRAPDRDGGAPELTGGLAKHRWRARGPTRIAKRGSRDEIRREPAAARRARTKRPGLRSGRDASILNWRGLARYWKNEFKQWLELGSADLDRARGSTIRRSASPCGLRRRRRRHAIDGAEARDRAAARRRPLGSRTVSFELELHEAEQRDRHRRLAFDVDAEVADVARDHRGEARRAALILPRQPGRQRDGAALGAALVGVVPVLRSWSVQMCFTRPPDESTAADRINRAVRRV